MFISTMKVCHIFKKKKDFFNFLQYTYIVQLWLLECLDWVGSWIKIQFISLLNTSRHANVLKKHGIIIVTESTFLRFGTPMSVLLVKFNLWFRIQARHALIELDLGQFDYFLKCHDNKCQMKLL